MKYLWIAGSLLACALSALAGLTAGVNLNPESTVRFVPNWGSLGDWVAGLGALLAVGVALWQAHQMRLDDAEKLSITQWQGRGRWVISIVSCGRRPSRVMGVELFSKKLDVRLPIKSFIFSSNKVPYPATLNYSENIDLVTGPGFMLDLAQNASFSFSGDFSDLEVVIKTTIREFKQPVLNETKVAFLNASKEVFDKQRESAPK